MPGLSDSSTHIRLLALPTSPKSVLPKTDTSTNKPQGKVKQSKAKGIQAPNRLVTRKKPPVDSHQTYHVRKVQTCLKPTSSRQRGTTESPDVSPQVKQSKATGVHRPKRLVTRKKPVGDINLTSNSPVTPKGPKPNSSRQGVTE